jgi:hypothetical protein
VPKLSLPQNPEDSPAHCPWGLTEPGGQVVVVVVLPPPAGVVDVVVVPVVDVVGVVDVVVVVLPPPAGVVAVVVVPVVDVVGVVLPPPLGVVAVVPWGEAAAWAGTITDFTIGFVHLDGSRTAVATPPIVKIFRICRRLCR